MTTTDQRPAVPHPGISVRALPARLRAIAEDKPDRVALREKEFGIWQETSYSEYWEMVQVVGAALLELGVGPGDKVAIHSENRKAWVWSDLAAQAIGAVSVGVYPTNPTQEVEYLLSHSEAVVLIAEDQEQVDKAMDVWEGLAALKTIVYIEPRGVNSYEHPGLMSWDAFVETGRTRLSANPREVGNLVDGLDPEDVATLVYTSGTTGPPKGAMLSHHNLVWVMDRVLTALADDLGDRVEILSYLPLCHIAERLYTLMIPLACDGTVNFAESIETVVQDLQEIQPTLFLGVPRIWERMNAGIWIRIADASPLKKLSFKLAVAAGMKNADRILDTGSRGFMGEITHRFFHIVAYRALREKLGMRHCTAAASAAAPIAPELLKFFMALGIPIYEAYAMTENTAYATANRPGNVKLGTVGVPNPDCELKLSDVGEILTRHGGTFIGYFKDPDATAETIDSEGWLHTGDVAVWDGDHVKIVDRIKDIIITAGGKNLSPSEIENKLKVSIFIKEAVVIGDKRKFVSALIGIEYDIVSNWALRKDITFTTYRDLSEKPEVLELIQSEVTKANSDLARVEQVKQFRLMPKELDHEDGELTATQKVKRGKINEMFVELVDDIYGAP